MHPSFLLLFSGLSVCLCAYVSLLAVLHSFESPFTQLIGVRFFFFLDYFFL
uniref:Hypothetical secreted peptide 1701 n=1 Tax=Amblyomma variegatum TaxID=34610 RepID=F0J9X8_AMBVA|nr:TPA_inf: hypothetical secreted peptide precursor 1701 [Amblyomma variegatum]